MTPARSWWLRWSAVVGARRAGIVGARVDRRCGAVRLVRRVALARGGGSGVPGRLAARTACLPRRIGVGWASGGQAGGAVAACSPHSCSPCENREVTPDGHTCPIDFEAAETVEYKSSLSKAP